MVTILWAKTWNKISDKSDQKYSIFVILLCAPFLCYRFGVFTWGLASLNVITVANKHSSIMDGDWLKIYRPRKEKIHKKDFRINQNDDKRGEKIVRFSEHTGNFAPEEIFLTFSESSTRILKRRKRWKGKSTRRIKKIHTLRVYMLNDIKERESQNESGWKKNGFYKSRV